MKLQPAAPQNAARPPPSWVLLLRGERRVKLTAGRAAPLHAASAAASCSTHTHGMEQQHGQEGRRFRMPQDSPFPRIVLCCFVVFGGCLITFYSPPSLTRPTERNRTTAGRGEQENRAKQRGHNSHPNETPSAEHRQGTGPRNPCSVPPQLLSPPAGHGSAGRKTPKRQPPSATQRLNPIPDVQGAVGGRRQQGSGFLGVPGVRRHRGAPPKRVASVHKEGLRFGPAAVPAARVVDVHGAVEALGRSTGVTASSPRSEQASEAQLPSAFPTKLQS